MKERSKIKVYQSDKRAITMNVLISAILAIIALIILLQFFPKIRNMILNYTKDQCFQEIISISSVETINEIQLKKCPIKTFIYNLSDLEKIELDEDDKRFMSEMNIPKIGVAINKVFGENLIKCFRKTGFGYYSLLSKVANPEIEKSVCVICSVIEFKDDVIEELKKIYGEKVELKDLKFITYLQYKRSVERSYYDEMRNKNPLLSYVFFAEENFNFPLTTRFYTIFTSYYGVDEVAKLFSTPAVELFRVLVNKPLKSIENSLISYYRNQKQTKVQGSTISLTVVIPYYSKNKLNTVCSYVANS